MPVERHDYEFEEAQQTSTEGKPAIPVWRIKGIQGVWYSGFSERLDPAGETWIEADELEFIKEVVKFLNLGGGWYTNQKDEG